MNQGPVTSNRSVEIYKVSSTAPVRLTKLDTSPKVVLACVTGSFLYFFGDRFRGGQLNALSRVFWFRMDPDWSDQSISERLTAFGDRLEEAAVEAEFRTGVHEESEAKAKSHILIRLARMTLGFLTVIIGIALLPLPGPGWVVIAGGLVILAQDFVWAEKTLRYVRRKAPGIPEDGKIPLSSWISMAVVMGVAVGAALLVQRYVELDSTWRQVQDWF